MDDWIARLFAVSPDVRYVALSRNGRLVSRQRDGLSDASAAESDRYEELLVNPTLLTLVTQRGRIDCGGARYLLVRYGRFFQAIFPLADGHVSVALEPSADAFGVAARIEAALATAAASPEAGA